MDILKESEIILKTVREVLKKEKIKHQNARKNISKKLPTVSIVADNV